MPDQGGADVVEHAGCAVRGARELELQVEAVSISHARQHASRLLSFVPRKL